MKKAAFHPPEGDIALGNKTAFSKDQDISCSVSLIDAGATSLCHRIAFAALPLTVGAMLCEYQNLSDARGGFHA